MVSYGQWTQAPDYEAVGETAGVGTSVQRYGQRQYRVETLFPEDRHIVLTPEATTAVIGANETLSSEAALDETFSPNTGPLKFDVSYFTEIPPGEILPLLSVAEVRTEMYYHPLSISPWSEATNSWAPSFIEMFARGAIGWQWQSDLTEGTAKPSSVVTAILTGTQSDRAAYRTVAEGTVFQEPGVFMPAGVTTRVQVTGGMEFESDDHDTSTYMLGQDTLLAWSGPDFLHTDDLFGMSGPNTDDPDPIPVGEYDITDRLDPLGRAVVSSIELIDILNPVVLPPLPEGEPNSAGSSFGYTLIPEIQWTFRPPVFRWIYDTNTPAPPLRRKQRNDDAINGVRNRSAASSRQRSLRNRGYL